jgi:hypothetical protein
VSPGAACARLRLERRGGVAGAAAAAAAQPRHGLDRDQSGTVHQVDDVFGNPHSTGAVNRVDSSTAGRRSSTKAEGALLRRNNFN